MNADSWYQLAQLGIRVRPHSGVPPASRYLRSQFSARFGATVSLLARELRALQAKNIVLELDVRERDLRLDGFPRADARLGTPAIVLSFESKYGPLRYATGEYSDWQDNLRAVALSMEALRAVDRYGVSKRGEQYTGWKALPSRAGDVGINSPVEAREYLERTWGGDLKRALMDTHPDRGGDVDEFRKVIRAKELLA